MVARLYFIILICALFMLSASMTHAQDVDTENTRLIYYEDENPHGIDWFLLRRNICYEAVLRLNPELDIENIPYGTRIIIPIDEPCYNNLPNMWSSGHSPRLKYYEDGQWLEEPYYTEHVRYFGVHPTHLTFDQLVDELNICLDVLLADNFMLHDFERYVSLVEFSIDVFIPQDAPSCAPNWIPPSQRFSNIIISANDANSPYFSQQLNICAESISALFRNYFFYQTNSPNVSLEITLPTDAPPCYNEEGQRLRFYDDLGYPLAEPVYTDLEVYIAQAGETLETIAEAKQVCLIDLVRINYFPDLPTTVPIELFIPPRGACSDDLEMQFVEREVLNITMVATRFNVCPETLILLNPHIYHTVGRRYPRPVQGLYRVRENPFYAIITPKGGDPCYQVVPAESHPLNYDLELTLNICMEEFNRLLNSDDIEMIYIRFDAPPCYNAEGKRLAYRANIATNGRDESQYEYRQAQVYQAGDTVYQFSRRYNVCVHDLLALNSALTRGFAAGNPVFIPDTHPCYDDATGFPLIYEDENGDPLPVPQVSDQLIYYGSQPLGYISYYYKVCQIRINEANRAKLDGETYYLGWIIPTERPPCYDEMGARIYYACYNQPVDLTRDYSAPDAPPITIDPDGTYCYDLQDSQTVVWHQNQRYEIVEYKAVLHQALLSSPAFMAWCFGVPLDDLIYVNESFGLLNLDHLRLRVIPPRTRECYMTNPSVLDGHQTIRVNASTLSDLSQNYPYTAEDFAAANDIPAPYLIFYTQELIIPTGISRSGVRVLVFVAVTLPLIALYLRRRLKRSITQP